MKMSCPPLNPAFLPAFLYGPGYENTSAHLRADKDLGNYSHSQGLMSSASTAAPFLEQDPSLVGRDVLRKRSSEKLSTLIEKPIEPPHSLQRRQRSIHKSLREARERRLMMFDGIRPLQKRQRQGSSEISKNAGDPGCPMPDTHPTKIEQINYTEDLMQSIRSRVLKVWNNRAPHVKMSLYVPCNVRGFMEKQYDGSNNSLGRVIVLTGTATCGQATTCSDYIHANWPLRGPWLLGMLQLIFDGCGKAEEGDRSLQPIVTLSLFQS